MQPLRPWPLRVVHAAGLAAGLLAGCGGGNPLGNPDAVDNPAQIGGQKLSFIYFQQCVDPMYAARGCAAGGCHDNTNGTGGALRLESPAAPANLADPADVIRASAMYRNFYSSQGEVVFGAPDASRLVNKPLVRNVLHGGGIIFPSEQDPAVRVLEHWINNPMPQGQDEFSAAGSSLVGPIDPATGLCTVP